MMKKIESQKMTSKGHRELLLRSYEGAIMSILGFSEIWDQKHKALVTKSSSILVALKFRMQAFNEEL